MAKKVNWSKAPKVNTQARVDFYKKNKLKMDDTTKLKSDTKKESKPAPKPNPRKKPTANEMKADGTNVPKLDLKRSKRASDNNEVDLYQDARDGMIKTRLKIQELEYDKERRAKEDKDKEGMTLSQRNKYDADRINKSVQKAMKESKSVTKMDYQLGRKDNQSIAKMIKKVKNSNCGSPSKALVFQPKNLNQHLEDNVMPAAGSKSEENDVPTVKEKKLTSEVDPMKKIIVDAKAEGMNNPPVSSANVK